MTSFPNSPKLLKGGIVLIDPDTSAVQRIIVLQYNPDTLSRTLQPQAVKESGDRSEAMRLTGPPVETINVETEIDAIDRRHLLQASVETELTRLSSRTDGLRQSCSRHCLTSYVYKGIQLTGDTNSIQLGRQIAQSVHAGIGHE
jgi:hypothetical protein